MKSELYQAVEKNKQDLFEINSYLYDNPETAFQEYKACRALSDLLRTYGFTVTVPAGGLETTFIAETSPTGEKTPCIDILAEYDALGLGDSYGREYSVAHACGHNVIAAAAVGAGAALKEIMERHHIPGTLRVVGTPAEEGGGGKIIMQNHGVFDHTDAMMMIHPTSGKSKIAGRCKCSFTFRVTYKGVAAHAGNHKERGVNAQDAANLCYTAIGCLRGQLPDDVQVFALFTGCSEERMIIPDRMDMMIAIRCFSEMHLKDAITRVKHCIQAGATATGCQMDIKESIGYLGRVCNHTLEGILRNNVKLLEEPLMDGMVDDNGGEDFGNLNRRVPGIMLYPSLLPERKISNHTLEFYQLCNSGRAREMILLGSRALAYTALDLFQDPALIGMAKKELAETMKAEG